MGFVVIVNESVAGPIAPASSTSFRYRPNLVNSAVLLVAASGLKQTLAIIAPVIVLATLALIAPKRRDRRQKAARPVREDRDTAASAGRRGYYGPSLLVTQPGKCRWDRELAQRGPRPSRLEQFGLPRIYTPDELAAFLGLDGYKQLVHLADLQDEQRYDRPTRIQNYSVRTIPKRGGGERVLFAPKPRLKAAQRKILHDVLDKVPVHPAATAYRRGCDVKANATAHAARQVVLCYDLRDFFPSIRRQRVAAFFQWLGYHPKVARILSFLCTVSQPPEGRRGLPQGAPTSPALANAICYRLDCRLAGLAKKFGAAYTRYADDLTFSGDEPFKRGLSRFVPLAERIIRGERFQLHPAKRRFMRRGTPQRVTGLLVNDKPSVGRAEIDRLKALLHNAAKAGSLESQNGERLKDFPAHLRGRIAWIARFHPARAAKLRRQLDSLAPPKPR